MCHLPTHHQRQRRPGPTWRPRRSILLAALALPSAAIGLTLPSFGAGVPAKKARRSVGGRSSSGGGAPAGRARTMLQSSLAVDDEASGLWRMRSDGFDAFDNRDESRGSRSGGRDRRKRKQTPKRSLVPFGPVPRGGSLSDVRVLPSSSAASAALELTEGSWSGVRRGARGVRRAVVRTVVSANGVLRFGARERRRDESPTALEAAMTADAVAEAVDRRSPLRIGGAINRRLRRRRSVHVKTGAVSDSAVLAAQTEAADAAHMDAWAELESALEATADVVDEDDPFSLPLVGRFFQRNDASVEDSVMEARYEGAALASRGGASAVARQATSSITSLSSSSVASVDSMETYVIETPLFPIILPKIWEPPVSASSSVTIERRATLEISVAVEEAASVATDAKPSPQLLAAATQPFLPKDAVDTFTGREFYYPQTISALSETGMKMTLGQGRNPWVNWSGEKKTEAFLRSHGVDGGVGAGAEWYDALDDSQEVLVWVGKATSREGYGAELPIIKTTSIIHKSPKYLAELLMDSERVKIYNKMSLGRTDEKVFQTGIETQGGEFGDGESKVVRNLTKPPMVSSLIEFVTCMHARRLRPDDTSILGESDPAEGYLVVSRAVTGGEWSAGNTKSSTGEKLSRNEILMGVNILRSVPGEPDKTELTAITHVYSPMIPQMLARSAGVKGAMDFIRDMRALP